MHAPAGKEGHYGRYKNDRATTTARLDVQCSHKQTNKTHFISLMEMKLSILVTPKKCKGSGMSAWNRVSCTPATIRKEKSKKKQQNKDAMRKLFAP
jgi:hypothetical protein